MKLVNSIAAPSWIAGFKISIYRCRNCNRSLALGQASARKAGIKIREHWYCSSHCFTSAAERELCDLLKTGHEQSASGSRVPLGLSLMSSGLLTTTQYKEAIDKQKEVGGDIGEMLVRTGSLSEKQVTAVRATRWGCPVFTVPKHGVQTSIEVPATLLKACSAIPLHYVAATKLLLMGFVKDIEYGLLYAIEQMTGCKTQPCFVTPSDFQSQMQERELPPDPSSDEASKEVKIEGVQTPAEMARTLCSFVVDFEADEARIVKCKGYVWSRLKAGPKAVDLLFRAV
jgi:hypothetical protein